MAHKAGLDGTLYTLRNLAQSVDRPLVSGSRIQLDDGGAEYYPAG